MRKLLIILGLLISGFADAQIKEGTINFNKNNSLQWITESFEPESHTLDYCLTESGQKFLCTIDDKPWYGSDMGDKLPKNQVIMLRLKLFSGVIDLDVSGMFDAGYGGELSETQFLLKKEGPYYMLYGYFSDGAGTYTAHWKIVKNSSVREVISNDEAYFTWQDEK